MRTLRVSIAALFLIVVSARAAAALFSPAGWGVLASNAGMDVSSFTPDDGAPAVATNGEGVFIAVWVSPDDSFGDPGNDHLLFSRSTDGGRTWSAADPIASSAEDSWAFLWADISYSSNGTWIAAWMSADSALVARSIDDGATWSTPIDVDTSGNDIGGEVSITGDSTGVWVLVWRNSLPMGGSDQLYYSRSIDDGLTWSPEASFPNGMIAAEGGFSEGVVRTNDEGTWLAVFDSVGYGLESSRSIDGGATWSFPESVSTDQRWGLGIGLASNGDDDWVVSWSLSTTDKVSIARSTDDGQSWGTPEIVGGQESETYDAQRVFSSVAFDDGSWLVFWDEALGNPAYGVGIEGDIVGARSFDGVTWTDVGALNANARIDNSASEFDVNWDREATIASGAGGASAMVYLSTNTMGGTLGDDFDVFFARSDDRCPTVPSETCAVPTRTDASTFSYKNPFGMRDKLQWKWRYGEETLAADFGDPTTTSDYALCVYDKAGGSVRNVLEVQALAGKTCKTGPCWRTGADGSLRYRDPDGRHGPVRSVLLVPGGDGATTIKLKAQGPAMMPAPMPLALDPSMRVQLVNAESGACWEAVFSSADTNLANELRARAD